MYVRSGVGQRTAAVGLGAYTSAAPGDDPAQILNDTIAQAKNRSGLAVVFGLAMLAGVGWLFSSSGRR